MKYIFALLLITSWCKASPIDSIPDVYAPTSITKHLVFLELGGNVGGFSMNYDHRILDGLSVRAGLGIYAVIMTEDGFVSPVALLTANYLLPVSGQSHFVEVGAGPMIHLDDDLCDRPKSTFCSRVKYTVNLGYRYQPVDGGFTFRIGWTPRFNFDFIKYNMIGLSLGHSF